MYHFKRADPMHQFALTLNKLRFAYKRTQPPVIHIDDWQVERGERVFLYGPSGVGKSTLLNLLAGMQVPDAGAIDVLGERISAMKGAQRDRFRARHIGVIFQQFNLIPWLSVRDNIVAAHYFAGRGESTSLREKRILDLLDSLRLPHTLLERHTAELSVGQQQRVAIARALINEPELLIADEPTSSLDAETRDDFMQLLLDVAQSSTLIFVSHDRSLARHFTRSVNLQELNLAAKEGAHAL